jgi:hypothetical protein
VPAQAGRDCPRGRCESSVHRDTRAPGNRRGCTSTGVRAWLRRRATARPWWLT